MILQPLWRTRKTVLHSELQRSQLDGSTSTRALLASQSSGISRRVRHSGDLFFRLRACLMTCSKWYLTCKFFAQKRMFCCQTRLVPKLSRCSAKSRYGWKWVQKGNGTLIAQQNSTYDWWWPSGPPSVLTSRHLGVQWKPIMPGISECTKQNWCFTPTQRDFTEFLS